MAQQINQQTNEHLLASRKPIVWLPNGQLQCMACENIAPDDIYGTLVTALKTIRDLPIPEQDNMLAANMREIARAALSSPDTSLGDLGVDVGA